MSLEKENKPLFLICTLLTAALLALALPPSKTAFVAWFALVPLLAVLGRSKGRAAWIILLTGGWAWGIASVFWLRHVTWLGTIFLGLYFGAYFLTFFLAVRWATFKKGIPLIITAPVLWTALEHFRGFFLTGMPMGYLAHTQYQALPVIQIADIFGATAVTFWIVAVNAALAELVRMLLDIRPRVPAKRVAVSLAAVALISAASLGYGYFRLKSIVVEHGPVIAVVQGNIEQDIKNRYTQQSILDIMLKHVDLTAKAQSAERKPALVIWPETMAPPYVFDKVIKSEYFGELAGPTARALIPHAAASDLLISAVSAEGGHFNSTFYIKKGDWRNRDRYDKIHLVPFGEYVPLKPVLGLIVKHFVPLPDLFPGKEMKLFEVEGWSFAPTICYEDTFPSLVAQFSRGYRRADFIVNITNEGWFKDGAELDQHLAIGVFRAVENRAGFIRCANTGISAFIEPTGKISAKLEVAGSDREVAGYLTEQATRTKTVPPYHKVGETFAWLSLAAALAILGWAAIKLNPATN